MESNRESARRSRERKRQHLEELIRESARLGSENDDLRRRIEEAAQRCQGVDSQNDVLRGQLAELATRLENLNAVLRMVQEFSGVAVDIPEMPDPLLQPWRLPCPAKAVWPPTTA